MKLCMVLENGYTGLVRFFLNVSKIHGRVYPLDIGLSLRMSEREGLCVGWRRESEEMEWINEQKICLGESEQTELHGFSV